MIKIYDRPRSISGNSFYWTRHKIYYCIKRWSLWRDLRKGGQKKTVTIVKYNAMRVEWEQNTAIVVILQNAFFLLLLKWLFPLGKENLRKGIWVSISLDWSFLSWKKDPTWRMQISILLLSYPFFLSHSLKHVLDIKF